MSDAEPAFLTKSALVASRCSLAEQHVFETAVHKTRMAMALSDPRLPDCPLVFVNPAFIELTGYDAEAVVGRNCRFLQGPETDRNAVARIREAVRKGEAITEELYNYRRDGSGFWNSLYVSPIFDDNGALIYFFASQSDSSVRKEAERRQTQRVASMGALVSGIAHKFNNLMTVVLGNVELAASRAMASGQQPYLERARWGANQAAQLAGDLLALAPPAAETHRIIDLNEALREMQATKPLQPAAARIELDLAPEPVRVHVAPAQLKRAVVNLVRNAVDATPPGGIVRVATRSVAAAATALAPAASEAVALTVADSGEGMPPAVQARATELFFTTKAEASGVGLFLVLEFADKAGGQMAIDSQVGQGTTVTLVLPRASG